MKKPPFITVLLVHLGFGMIAASGSIWLLIASLLIVGLVYYGLIYGK